MDGSSLQSVDWMPKGVAWLRLLLRRARDGPSLPPCAVGPARRAPAHLGRVLEGTATLGEGCAKKNGERVRVFCASHADWLDNQVPPQWRTDLAREIEATPELIWQLLTKRIENCWRLAPWLEAPQNFWLGVTAEDQLHYEKRWAILRDIPARVRFISYEPALGPLIITGTQVPDWIICGGESGLGARMMDPAWARALRDLCRARGIPFFMKQMTGKKPIPADLLVREFPNGL
jgi:protein gp37